MTDTLQETILFRCSRLGDLMTGGTSGGITEKQAETLAVLLRKHEMGKITAKQSATIDDLLKKKNTPPELGDTAKTLIRNIWLEREFGYREDVVSDEIMKGHLCEQDSMALVQSVLGGEFRAKNTIRFENEYIIGTPDVVLKKEDCLEDVKTSYNLRTFIEAELIKSYLWQLMGYMWLTGKKNARLIYCLVPTPDDMILEQQRRICWKFGADENNPDYIARAEQIQHNNDLIALLPIEKRIKVFNIQYDPDMIEALKARIELARAYYQTLKL